MAARTDPFVQGKQNVITVKKPGDATFTLIGCLSKYSLKKNIEAIERACRAASGMLPSGDDFRYEVTLEGIQHVYPADQVDANVSSSEIEDLVGTVIEIKVGGTLVGDPIRSCEGFFTEYNEENDQKGLATYSATFVGTKPYTKSVVAA